ncbi:hypothetical protein AB0L71_28565 [Streptomyces sp. NPDC052052]|uniref:hypothetical protein n=1 Tax=Streptomyces sp. NPDC052052 TaxID=3154756 RepID=UPI00343557A6
MPAKFLTQHCTINWHGTDDDTPPGHTTAIGTDAFGVAYLWLFKGDQPTDDAFIGSILIPDQAGQMPVAYGPGGGLVGDASDAKAALARLADRATEK